MAEEENVEKFRKWDTNRVAECQGLQICVGMI